MSRLGLKLQIEPRNVNGLDRTLSLEVAECGILKFLSCLASCELNVFMDFLEGYNL